MEHECWVGVYYNYDDTDLITFSDLKSFPQTNYETAKNLHCLTTFDYCPVCGKKIDWSTLTEPPKEGKQ